LNARKKAGSFGMIFDVFNLELGKESILKIQTNKDIAIKEMKITCLVSDFPNFVKFYNAWICDIQTIDKVWKESWGYKKNVAHSKLHHLTDKEFVPPVKLYYLEMEKCVGSLDNLESSSFTENDKLSICFELFNAYEFAYKKIGLFHKDFRVANIFYNYNQETRKYIIEGKTNKNKKRTLDMEIECKSLFYPIIGDFGLSTINNKYDKYSEHLYNDIKMIIIFLELYDLFDEFKKMQRHDNYSYRINNISNEISHNKFKKWLGQKVIESNNGNKKMRLK
jgi:hypothetical protein